MKRGAIDPGPATTAQAGHVSDGSPPVSLRVFQWEIDPNDPNPERGEHDLTLNGREYRVWWQFHVSGLVYASVQATQTEHESNVVANLVYDRTRDGVVAVYGTASDFGPFVEAFRRAYGI
jgi:hypothetical protein